MHVSCIVGTHRDIGFLTIESGKTLTLVAREFLNSISHANGVFDRAVGAKWQEARILRWDFTARLKEATFPRGSVARGGRDSRSTLCGTLESAALLNDRTHRDRDFSGRRMLAEEHRSLLDHVDVSRDRW